MKCLTSITRTLLLAVALSAHASLVAFEVDGINYDFVSPLGTEVKVVALQDIAYSGDVVVPSTVSYESLTYDVVAVGERAFYKCTELNMVVLPHSVTSIGNYAFYGCKDLVSVSLPEDVREIGYCAFSGCLSLYDIHLPEKLSVIRTETFKDCSSLLSIQIPDSVKYIGPMAFKGCSKMESVTLSDDIDSICSNAFQNCSALTSFRFPERTNAVNWEVLSGCTNITEIVIPDSVTIIYPWAFRGCERLRAVTLGCSLTTLADGSFNGCTNIQKITSHIEDPFQFQQLAHNYQALQVFPDEVYEFAQLVVPKGTKEKYQSVYKWNNFKTIVEEDGNADGISQATQDSPVTLYDLQGRRLTGRPGRGLYIREGKKVVIK